MSDVTCAPFRDRVEELAVGGVAEPERTRLLSHAATCEACHAELEVLAGLADQLLLLAPPLDAPEGFEARAVARMRPAASGRADPRHRRLFAVLAAAALVLAALAIGVVVGRAGNGGAQEAGVRVAAVEREGQAVGEVRLVAGAQPVVVLTASRPQPFEGERHCYLILPDGQAVWAGAWSYEGITSGVWAAVVEPRALTAVRMEIRDDAGTVLATATF